MQYFVLKPQSLPADWLQAACCDVPTADSLGMVTAEAVKCLADVPNYTSSLRDGWAVSSRDNGKPRVRGSFSVENGEAQKSLSVGQAVWVNTGGAVPLGADAVIACRDAMDAGRMNEVVEPWQNIERRGCDWTAGDTILPAGVRIGAREMALLYEAGVVRVTGWALPRAAVVATGSEMIECAGDAAPGCRRCSNASYAAALLSRIGLKEVRTLVVPDDEDMFARTLKELDGVFDVIVTVGGTGQGRRDYTRRAVLAAGGRFVGDDEQKDSPFVTARLKHAGLIGLPGNPLAVMMLVQRVLLETVRRVYHLPEEPLQVVRARMTAAVEPGATGELCVALEESGDARLPLAARPIRKGTGRMRVFETASGTVALMGQGLAAGETVEVALFRN